MVGKTDRQTNRSRHSSTGVISELRRSKQEEQKFKTTLCYIASSRLAWAT